MSCSGLSGAMMFEQHNRAGPLQIRPSAHATHQHKHRAPCKLLCIRQLRMHPALHCSSFAPHLPMDLHCLQAGYPVTLLSEQHRMHPAIAVWPSNFFYQGKLVTARSLADGKARRADFHSQPCFPPLAFFDCRHAGADLPLCLLSIVDRVSA